MGTRAHPETLRERYLPLQFIDGQVGLCGLVVPQLVARESASAVAKRSAQLQTEIYTLQSRHLRRQKRIIEEMERQ